MDKLYTAKRLLNDYTDFYGRVTLSPAFYSDAKEQDYDSENGHLFTGIGVMLLRLSGILDNPEIRQQVKSNVLFSLGRTEVVPGLHARHPWPFIISEGHHGISWDEHNGIFCSVAAFPELQGPGKTTINDIMSYGEKHNWAFIDERQGTNPYKEITKVPLKFIKALWAVCKSKDKSAEWGKYTILDDLTRVRQYRDRCFYKIISKAHTPSWFELLNLCLASVKTSKSPRQSTSGKVMAWFRFKAIEMVDFRKSNPVKNLLVRWTFKEYERNMTDLYGFDYLSVIMEIYYKDPQHPFHVLCKGLI